MAGLEEKYLDDISEVAAPEAAPEPVEPTTAAEAQPQAHDQPADGQEPAKRPDNRPEGYVTKGERDRIASELHQERQQRAAAEDRFAKMVERYYKENAPQKPTEEDWGPDPDVDPVGALKWQREQIKARAEAERNWQQQTQQRTQQEQGFQRAHAEVNRFFNAKVAEKPELKTLYDGLLDSYGKEYEALGYARESIPAAIEQQERQIINWAYQNNVPIDQVVERLAASRGVAAQPGQPQQEQKRDPATGQFVSEAEKAAKIAQSQERNASLGSAPGAPVKKMTAAELAKMPEEEMWRYFDGLKGQKGSKQFDREMGFRS